MNDPTQQWNEAQAADVELNFTCSRDNPDVRVGSRPRDILSILNEGNDRRRYPDWFHICKMAADEINSLRFILRDRANSELPTMDLVRDLVLMLERKPHDHRTYGCSQCQMIARANDYLESAAWRRRRSLDEADKLNQTEEQP